MPSNTPKKINPTCKNCGQPIEWQSRESPKFGTWWIPINPRAKTDHRETCVKLDADHRNKVRDRNHAARIREFFKEERRKHLSPRADFSAWNESSNQTST